MTQQEAIENLVDRVSRLERTEERKKIVKEDALLRTCLGKELYSFTPYNDIDRRTIILKFKDGPSVKIYSSQKQPFLIAEEF